MPVNLGAPRLPKPTYDARNPLSGAILLAIMTPPVNPPSTSPPPLTRRPRRDELAAHAGATLGDLVFPGVRLLFAGINPSLWSAAVGAHFARPGNRFWPALARAGITPRLFDWSAGMPAEDAAELRELGIGIAGFSQRATARADELTAGELRSGGVRLVERVAEWRPRVVAVLGLTAYRSAYGVKAKAGRQDHGPGVTEWWVLPNPSGLNAHESLESLARAYASVAQRAGVLDVETPASARPTSPD